ncbi:MAG: metal ABC transporter substrate-binding protein [Chthoniobacteraceae bacterium]|jgi:zinc transport system substrate-binding protein
MSRAVCLLAIWLLAGCLKQDAALVAASPAPTPPKKLLVLATFAPMYCFTKNVAGDLADVEMIVPPDVRASEFKPSPEQVRRILQADVIIENGFGFEGWMDQIEAHGLRPGQERVLAARGTGPGIPGLPGDPDSPPSDAQFDPTQPPDPHVWLDPVMAIREVQNIRDALMARDPAHADDYLANENHYEAALRDMDDQIGQMTVDIPKREVICEDRTFLYFLSRYQFTVAAIAGPGQPVNDLQNVDAIIAAADAHGGDQKGSRIILNPMESGPASTDFYEQATLANVDALRKGLLR